MTELKDQVSNLAEEVKHNTESLRELTGIVARLIRIEEKNLAMEKDINGFGVRMQKCEDEMIKVSIKTALNSSKGDLIGRWVERLLFIIVIAALSSFEFFKHKAG